LATTQSNGTSDAVQQVCEQFSKAVRRQAEQIEKLDQGLKLLRNEQQQLEQAAARMLERLEQTLAGSDQARGASPSTILSSVRTLATATYAEQVFEVLAEEAARMNVRSAVFDVRGRAAWGASARGFDPELPREALRTLVVPLNQASPFRQAFETAEAVETNPESLEGNRNLLVKLGPAAKARILLLPVLSAGSVAAIFYADAGERRDSNLIDTLKVLAEFAGAQLDRLMAMSSGLAEVAVAPAVEESETASEFAAAAPESTAETTEPEAASSLEIPQAVAAESSPAELSGPLLEEEAASPAPLQTAGSPDEPQAPSEAPDIAQAGEEEQKIHRDAMRFSKLLVSEIELYNKNSVAEGRRNKDLYQRLEKDIKRSRETYEKRFAHTVAKQVDYFHEELVKTLAENDPMLLGSGYPGPSV